MLRVICSTALRHAHVPRNVDVYRMLIGVCKKRVFKEMGSFCCLAVGTPPTWAVRHDAGTQSRRPGCGITRGGTAAPYALVLCIHQPPPAQPRDQLPATGPPCSALVVLTTRRPSNVETGAPHYPPLPPKSPSDHRVATKSHSTSGVLVEPLYSFSPQGSPNPHPTPHRGGGPNVHRIMVRTELAAGE